MSGWTRARFTRSAIALAIGIVMIYLGASCGAPISAKIKNVTCRGAIDNVHGSHHNVGRINVVASGACVGAATRLSADIQLQKRLSSGWTTVAVSDSSQRVLYPKSGRVYKFSANTFCASGDYRGVASLQVQVRPGTTILNRFGQAGKSPQFTRNPCTSETYHDY